MVTKKFIIGVLAVVVTATYVMITLEGQGVRIKVNAASTNFYIFDGTWALSGTEVINLYNKSAKVVKNSTIVGYTNRSDGMFSIIRTTSYKNNATTFQEYMFNSSDPNLKDFPVVEKITIVNGHGMTLRHETTKLNYVGSNYDIKNETELTFGKMKLEFPGGYSFGRVYSTGRVRIDYKVMSDYEKMSFRMYDPAAPVKINMWTNGTWTNKTVEIGEPLNITAVSNVTNLSVCLSVNHSYLGDSFTCDSDGTLMYYWNPTCSVMKFNDSATSKEVNYSLTANQTVYVRLHSEDKVSSFKLNLTGENTSGDNYPYNVKVYLGDTLVQSIPGSLKETEATISTFNDSSTSKNFTFYKSEYKTAYIKINKGAAITDATVNVTGYSLSVLDVDNTTYTVNGELNYDAVVIRNNGTLNVNGSWLNITGKNITVDSSSWINATGVGNAGGASVYCTGGNQSQGNQGSGTGFGGAGGISWLNDQNYEGGGGGASYGGFGGVGTGYAGCGSGGKNGTTYGEQDGLSIEPGSGGGSGGCAESGATTGKGGNGGGAIILNATYVNILGNITTNGESGGDSSSTYGGGGGGGSGGGILIIGKYVNIAGDKLIANGGNGGSVAGKYGGGAGGGRIKIFYKTEIYNTSALLNVSKGTSGSCASPPANGTDGTSYTSADINLAFDVENYNIGTNYYPLNPYIDVEGDGDSEWIYNGTFDQADNQTSNLSSSFANYLSACTALADGTCNVPVVAGSSSGILHVSAISIVYSVVFNPVSINASYINNYLASQSYGYRDVPIRIEASQGNITVNAINSSYNGSCVLNITASWAGNATYSAGSNVTFITLSHSNFTLKFPYTFMTEPIFLPITNNSKNVSMYGQTSVKPGYNITGKNPANNFNVSIRINQSMDSCMNMTVGTSNSVYNFTVNTTRRTILTNVTYNQSAGLWLKLNMYNCNSSTVYRDWWIELDACCYNCLRCW